MVGFPATCDKCGYQPVDVDETCPNCGGDAPKTVHMQMRAAVKAGAANLKAEEDLLRLRYNQVPEGIEIEYKAQLYEQTPAGNKEFLKDVSSFANTAGGHHLIGVTTVEGVPADFPGVAGDLDKEVQRLESLLRDRMEPRIIEYGIAPVRLSRPGPPVLVIEIPRSWNPPHAIRHNDTRLICARNSSGVHLASVDEMRAMFTKGATLLARAKEFQRERIKEIHNSGGPGPQQFIGEGGRVVLHIVPFAAVSSDDYLIDLNLVYGKNLNPLYHGQVPTWGYNADGYYTASHPTQPAGYVQVFRNGIVETATGDVRTDLRTAFSGGQWSLDPQVLENEATTKVFEYMSTLSSVGVLPPFFVMLGGVRMHGTLVRGPETSATQPQIQKPDLHFPVVTLNHIGEREIYRQALKPIFDALWKAAGYAGWPPRP